MGCWSNDRHGRWADKMERMQFKMERMRDRMERRGNYAPTSGNRAFDDYRMETLRRLEEEQVEFRELPRPPASCQGQGRVRCLHGAATPASDAAERSASGLNWPS